MKRLLYSAALLCGVAVIVAPVAISQPLNPYVLTAAKIATALGYTPASAALTNTHILVGNGSNVATDVAMSGHATISNTGAVTVTAPAGTLTGATLAAGVTASSLTSLGTISGTVKGAGFNVGPAATGNLVNIYGNASASGDVFIGTNYYTTDGRLVLGTFTTPTSLAIATNGIVSTVASIVTGGYTVGSLPVAPGTGARAYVSDQLTACPTLGGAFTGGGSVVCSAFYDGTAWTHQ